jgi:hypothetical protein
MQGMHCVTLITRPGRAAALVVTVGLLLGLESALALGGSATAAGYVLVAALVAATLVLGVFAPLHSRSGTIAVTIARAGLVLAVVPVAGALAVGSVVWLPLLVTALSIAALGMASLVRACRHEGDIPARLLTLALAGTVLGILFAPAGGCALASLLWLALGAALWSAYAAPSGALRSA